MEDEAISDLPQDVLIEQDKEGRLHFSCDCEKSGEAVCLHQTATLFAFADRRQEVDGLCSAVDSAIKDRIKRAKSEVKVEAEAGQLWFGSWRASSINSTFPRHYRVVIRNLHERTNFCSCPDFVGNQLGTCKHIEAVLHKIQKNPQYEDFKKQPPPFPYVYIAWGQDGKPMIRIHRTQDMPLDLQTLLDKFFAASGEFKGRLPEEFFSFTELADQRQDIHIGDDADDMGLSKTLQAIAAAIWLKNHEGVTKILIVCPASLKQQWAREIAKFSDLQSQIIGGPPQKRQLQYRRQVSFFILNYELILRDLSVINQDLCPDLIIMDEAQRIKNWRTKIASAIKLIPSRYAFVLTGTPLENKLEDLYSLMQVVDPKILEPLWRYMMDFHVMDERGKILGYRNLSLLRKRLEPVMLRRDRSLVDDQLPERTNQRLDVGMTEKQLEIHGSALQTAGSLANIARKHPPYTHREKSLNGGPTTGPYGL